ncbi:fibrobacter succinogenes major paralogous domain-containing protein [Pedobacter gandavensis]|uniref:Fibronectin type-III domain-containing protein n=1 Tax=Pedobacter gandavensis TaxID=2679963 RepID=A0ABR6EZP7_9SPHI|nr:hypothetical protein [Pedobacter gandavensis]MBB2150641.1 hypothetical protein [Pedobacter gandavensis]
MKKFLYPVLLFLLFLGNEVFAQQYFSVLNGIPQLAVLDQTTIQQPKTGMLVYSSIQRKPLIYNGTNWENLCTNTMQTVSAEDYFMVKEGIPYLPVLNKDPANSNKQGTIYFSSIHKAAMIYNGNAWIKIQDLSKSIFTPSSGFESGTAAQTFKLPILLSDPAIITIHTGAFYLNASSKSIRYFDGLIWQDLKCVAEVSTLAVTDIKGTTALGHGEVMSNGGADMSIRGFCWSTNPNPDISLNTKTVSLVTDGGLGDFTGTLSNLLQNTTYHVRAYATNSQGTVYGEDRIFTTLYDLPTIITLPVNAITSIDAISGGEITDDGGSPVSSRGIRWSIKGDPADDKDAIMTNDGSGVGVFPSSLVGLLGNTTYYVRAYAVNVMGTAYGNLLSFTTPPPVPPVLSSATVTMTNITDHSATGKVNILNNGGAVISERGFLWSTDQINWTHQASETINPSDIGIFVSNLSNLLPGTTYYAKGYASNSAGTSYTSETSFITNGKALIITSKPNGITGVSAYSGGLISTNGGAQITARGVCWSTNPMPTIDLSTKTEQSVVGDGTGSFTSMIKDLSPLSTYYVRAYAVNDVGVAYGNEEVFQTPGYPTVNTLTVGSFFNNTAKGSGQVLTDGGAVVLSRGLVWSTAENPTLGNAASSNSGSGLGVFTSMVSGLEPNTVYHLRAYATNVVGTVYGADKTFTLLPGIPELSTQAISAITNRTATGGGIITSNGDADITARGVYWSQIGDPGDPQNQQTSTTIKDGLGTGTYQSFLSNLMGNTLYYVRAYAENRFGKAYGDLLTFISGPVQPPVLTNNTIAVKDIADTKAMVQVWIQDNGGAPIISKGIAFSTDRLNYQHQESAITNPDDIGEFNVQLAGLLPGTVYYVKGYASNSAGTTYSKELSFTTPLYISLNTSEITELTSVSASTGGKIVNPGSSAITFRGVAWGTGPNPTIADQVIPNEGNELSFVSYLKGLTGSTTYYVRAYAGNAGAIVYGNQEIFRTAPAILPEIKTLKIENIGGVTATSIAEVINDGGSPVTSRGICWNTTGDPEITDEAQESGQGTGVFSTQIKNLSPLTKYYVRAYAINDIGVVYGNELSFTTATIATLSTLPASLITANTASSGGHISADGGTPVLQSGICWSTTGMPTTADAHTDGGLGIGSFVHGLTDLLGNTTYYIRAYAMNSAGIAYGDVQQFVTSPPVLATLSTTIASSGSKGITGTSGGKISSNGGAVISDRGLVWSTIKGFDPEASTTNRINSSGAGNFSMTMTALLPGTIYYVRAFASNSAGTAYAVNELQFTTFDVPELSTNAIALNSITSMMAIGGGTMINNGGTEVTSSGICWSTSPQPTINEQHSSNNAGTGVFSLAINGLLGNTTYQVRAYAINSVGIAYGAVQTFKTQPAILATLSTNPAILTSASTATVGGTILSNGGALVTTRGFVWSTDANFNPDTITENKTIETGDFTGSFSTKLTGLAEHSVYYVRAYIVNSAGTTYGNIVSFITPQKPVLTTTYAIATGSTVAKAGAEINNDGGSAIAARGMVWSLNPVFNADTITVNKTYHGGGNGAFESNLNQLKANTTYYVQAYATNAAGTSYGNLLSFKTDPPVLATLSTKATTGTTGFSTITGGNISNDGGAETTTRGMVWSTQAGFRPDTISQQKTVQPGVGIGGFSSVITGLKAGTTYYIRAYVNNSVGTAYGNELSFITPIRPTLTTIPVAVSSAGITAVGGGTIISDGAATIINQGVVWSTLPNPMLGTANETSYDMGNGSTFRSTLIKLEPTTLYYVRAYASNSEGTAYGNELTFTTPAVLPTITTSYITPSSKTSATTGGQITKDGGAAITNRGVVWSTDKNFNPDTELLNRTNDGQGIGSFNSEVTGLKMSIAYYVRAYAQNAAGTAYGNQVKVTLFPTAPVLNTEEVTSLGGFSATSGGTITSDGGADVIQKGLVWSIKTNPTIYDNISYHWYGMDPFISTMTGLTPNILYYVRAYAQNNIGVAYGVERSFLTNAFPTLSVTTAVTNINATTATSGGDITDDGRTPILARGLTWNTTGNPTLESSAKTVDNTTVGIGKFTSHISGLIDNTTYYIRAYATNAVGTTYGSQVSATTLPVTLPTIQTSSATEIKSSSAVSGGHITDDGGMSVTERGICWSTNPDPTTALITKLKDTNAGTGGFAIKFDGLTSGTTYYVRAYAVNIKGTAYGDQQQFTTAMLLPVISKVQIDEMTSTTAKVSAEIISDGGDVISASGLVWNTTGNPEVGIDQMIPGELKKGTFSRVVAGLEEGPVYYIRAFAINSVGTVYSDEVNTFKVCPPSFTVMHVAGLNGAPVTKTVTYNVVSSNLSGSAKCWITQNLGADQPANAANDGRESSSGWYWQFDNMQGYKNKAAVRTPATVWQIGKRDAADWQAINDPCRLLLGSGWRLPTGTEWSKTGDGPKKWIGLNDAYQSELKLHGAGVIMINSGGMDRFGREHYFWSSSAEGATYGNSRYATVGISGMLAIDKGYGASVRCLLETPTQQSPSVSNVVISAMTNNQTDATAGVTLDGGSPVTDRGLVWNTTGMPTFSDHVIPSGQGVGSFKSTLSSLSEGVDYFVRAYATNKIGTTYSLVETKFRLCPPSFTVAHIAGVNGAPVSKTVTYNVVSSDLSGGPRCWITQNLGADQPANSATDARESSSGWYFQFDKIQGYKSDGAVRTPATWEIGKRDAADWQAVNDPCRLLLGSGWRLPTGTEWSNVGEGTKKWLGLNEAYQSELKLHAAGAILTTTQSLDRFGREYYFWSSSAAGATLGNSRYATVNLSGMIVLDKGFGFSVRCLMEAPILEAPSISNVVISAMTTNQADATSVITLDGGTPVTARGLVWNTTGMPTFADHVIPSGQGVGSFKNTLSGLSEGVDYFVRAYATNKLGTTYSPMETKFRLCPASFTVAHIAGLNGAPVTKTVTYNVVSSDLSGASRCWITQNLGADQPASSPTDARESSSGWYFQFDRIQGYKSDGLVRTPATTWETGKRDAADWQAVNDPCRLLLGSGWRLPTGTEWTNAGDVMAKWLGFKDAYQSELKLHAAGVIMITTLSLDRFGSEYYFWSSTAAGATLGNGRYATVNRSGMIALDKGYGNSVRCIMENPIISSPTISNALVVSMATSQAEVTAGVALDGGSPVTARGLVWNTTGMPTLADQVVASGTGVGAFKQTLTGLSENLTYFVRAYATNELGTVYSGSHTVLRLCPSFTIQHIAGINGAPVTKTVTYNALSTDLSGERKCWITQNLGADRAAISATDDTESSAGWYWQFNRLQGYQSAANGRTPNTTWNTSITENADWTSANDPCVQQLGSGWRMPTMTEWTNAKIKTNWKNVYDAYNSDLKLHAAGFLHYQNGGINRRGTEGYFWATTQSTPSLGGNIYFAGTVSDVAYFDKIYAWSVRCLRGAVVNSVPTVSKVVIPAAMVLQGNAQSKGVIMNDGGMPLKAKGFVWNSTGNPDLKDQVIAVNDASYDMTASLTGLKEGTTYYVRAFATNDLGTAYSPEVTSFEICPTTFTAFHEAGINGAPTSKTIIYPIVNSDASGTAKCWIGQNLGATKQATGLTDGTEAAFGWYWQFNRSQGFEYNGGRTPASTWNAINTENSDWTVGNDPCSLLLGAGWRMPTQTEWANTTSGTQNWKTDADAYNSSLKLHKTGFLADLNGTSGGRGVSGFYWSSTQNKTANSTAWYLALENNKTETIGSGTKPSALPVRCLRDQIIESIPSVNKVSFSSLSTSSVEVKAIALSDGTLQITDRGFVWNTTGKPTMNDHLVSNGNGIGPFNNTISGWLKDQDYYLRAYATNAKGTAYSEVDTKINLGCVPITISHQAGVNGAPVSKTVTYKTWEDLDGSAKCWLSQNLGADQQATGLTDVTETNVGWYWAFNRSQAFQHTAGLRTPASQWVSVNAENSDWLPANDPCTMMLGVVWRMPTATEWSIVAPRFLQLKLNQAGFLADANGNSGGRGVSAFYWSSTQNTANTAIGLYMSAAAGSAQVLSAGTKPSGLPIRCLKN